jgi:phosphoribosylanthranilate isomerase (EC 5.3.1.24)
MARVKICGLRRERDMRVAAAAGADAVGFICDVDVETDREVNPSWAAALAESAPPFVTTVLVTMPDSVEDAVELAERVSPDGIQIHADFSPKQVTELSDRTNCDVLAAIDIADTDRAHELEGSADALLVDSLAEGGAGGTGETHDWAATYDLATELSTPVVLAGGLTPDNVAEAIDTAHPMGVDVSSGVEIPGAEGMKDDEAIRAFVENAGRKLDEGEA